MKDNDSKLLEEAYGKTVKEASLKPATNNVQNDEDINNFLDMAITDYLQSGMISDSNGPALEKSCVRGAKKLVTLIKNTTGADFSKYIVRR
jgi:hypothetical protein